MKTDGQEGSVTSAVAAVPSPGMEGAPERKTERHQRTWLVVIPLVLIVAYAFVPIVDNGFVVWDDNPNFLSNPYFGGLGLAQVKWAWTTSWMGVYQPLAWMLYETEYDFFQLDARGYHLTSVLLHVANAVALYFVTVTLLARCRTEFTLRSPWACRVVAALATALFAVHPLRVETVAWASAQMYLPCILFSLLSVFAYVHAFPRNSIPRWGWLVGSFVFFVTALLFHALPVSLPLVLLILDAYPLGRLASGDGQWLGRTARKVLWEKVPFVVVSLLFIAIAIAVREQSPFLVERYDALQGIAQACYAIWFYVIKTFLPWNLIVFYALPTDLHWLTFPYNISILATLAMTVASFLLRRRWPGLLATWLCYLVILAPSSGIVRNTSFAIAADRYSYMSMLGGVILAAAVFSRVWQLSSQRRFGAVGIIALGLGTLLVLTAMTRRQCRTWLNSETLWTHALAHGAESSFLAHNYMAVALQTKGQHEAAAAHYADSLRLNPSYLDAHNNLGTLLSSQGKDDAAAAQFKQALELDPGYADAHYNLAMILFRRQRYAEAEEHLSAALRAKPDSAEFHTTLGAVLSRQKRFAEAEGHFALAVRLSPGSDSAHFNLGRVCTDQGKYEAAAAHYAETIRLRPGHVGAHHSLGNALSHLGNYEAALAHYADAMRIDPGFAQAYNARAIIMAACPQAEFRDGNEAIRFATRACELTNWRDPRFLDTLAAAYAEVGNFAAALIWQQKAIELVADARQKDDFRTRLVLYHARKPYRLKAVNSSAEGPEGSL